MKKHARRLAHILSVTAFTLALFAAFPAPALGADTAITKEEWAAFLLENRSLKAADSALNATYREITASLSPGAKKSLITEQREWIRKRNTDAAALYPKGSPEYCRALAEATLRRESQLREHYLAKPVAENIPADPRTATVKPEQIPAPGKPSPEPAKGKPAAAKPGEGRKDPPSALPVAPVAKEKTPKQAGSSPKQAEPVTVRRETAADLTITVPSARTKRPARTIAITSAEFAASFNQLARSFQSAAFPLTPTSMANSGKTRTEYYQLSDGISLQFKYTEGHFERPEIITLIARQFMNAPEREKDEIAYALVNVLKTLSKDSPKTPEAKDAEISGFLRSLNNAFTADASRVWKNAGLVYVITYMKKSDLFAMVITRDANG